MKSRLSSTIWTLVFLNGLVLFAVLTLAFSAGKKAGEASLFDFGSPAGGTVILAIVLAAGTALILAWRFGALLGPLRALAEFSERLAAGDPRARADVNTNDELGYIAENLNRAVAKVSKATSNQDANDALQRSITELLSVINQVARGDLSQRGKVTSDALGNVTDSINYMLDNFTKVLERVRKAAMEVTACSNNILVAADEMQAGATQKDQEITNTSSAVKELTVSMKQVSNSAEASAEAARRALDAAEQGNRAVRDTLEGMQRIRASVQATAKKIKSLGDRSLEISEIINVINDITEQTNLLALNAAIEAARAGEAGRGFAVVADEVRKLAEGSARSAQEISALTREILEGAKKAVTSSESGAVEVGEGREMVLNFGQTFRQIVGTVEEINSMVKEIVDMSSQQATNNAIVVEALSEIAKAAEETASSSGGASSFTEEQTSAMEEMSASAQELSMMANDLLDMVGRFEAGGGQRTAAMPEVDRLRPEGRPLGSAVRGLARRPGVEKQAARS